VEIRSRGVLAMMLALEECQGVGMVRSHISDEMGVAVLGNLSYLSFLGSSIMPVVSFSIGVKARF